MKVTYNPHSMTKEEVNQLFEIAARVRQFGSTLTFIQEVLAEYPGKDKLDRDVFSYAVEALDGIEDRLDVTQNEFRELMTEIRKCRVYIDAPKDQTRYHAEPEANGEASDD